MNCEKCKKPLLKEKVVEFDEFGKLKEPKIYCYSCFIDVLTTQFKSLEDVCEKCGATLVLKIDDLEVDIEEGVIWYYCKNILETSDMEDFEEHDTIGEYIVQPEADWE